MTATWHTVYQQAFPWHRQEGMACKGYLLHADASFFDSREILESGRQVHDLPSLSKQLQEGGGLFSLVMETPDGLLLAGDSMGFFPLFYTFADGRWMVSDRCEQLLEWTREQRCNEEAFPGFRSAGFVLGGESLFRGIFRLMPGERLFLSHQGHVESDPGPYFLPEPPDTTCPREMRETFGQLLQSTTERIIRQARGQHLVVPLSGGYDSRLILCLLKQAGLEKVTCFTYGKSGPESKLSAEVARRLGYRWVFIDYTELNTKGFLQDKQFTDYASFAGNYASMPYLQEYFGVKALRERELIPNHSVFLPGHPGDNVAGSLVAKAMKGKREESAMPVWLRRHFYSFQDIGKKGKRCLEQQLASWFEKHSRAMMPPVDDFMPAVEAWHFKERLPKFVCHSARVFPFFGYGVHMPLADPGLQRFFSKLPYPLRENKRFYKQALEDIWFRPMGLCFGRDELTDRPQATAIRRMKWHIKSLMPPSWVRQHLKKKDWIHYARFTQEMETACKNTPHHQSKRIYSFNALICNWYIMRARDLAAQARGEVS